MNFATSTRQTPRFAQDGTPGEERTLVLELKLLADVGLLGLPQRGQEHAHLARVSRARPKVADYPFTTLVPNLGMVQYKDGLSFVMADIPGLIEGASEGVGARASVPAARRALPGADPPRRPVGAAARAATPLHDFDVLNRELERYSPELAKKPQVVAANKIDLARRPRAAAGLRCSHGRRGMPVFPVSAATGEGMQALLDAVAQVLFGRRAPHARALRAAPAAPEDRSTGRSCGRAVEPHGEACRLGSGCAGARRKTRGARPVPGA